MDNFPLLKGNEESRKKVTLTEIVEKWNNIRRERTMKFQVSSHRRQMPELRIFAIFLE